MPVPENSPPLPTSGWELIGEGQGHSFSLAHPLTQSTGHCETKVFSIM